MKVLIVEDEQRIAAYLKKGLELKSYTVDVAADGLDGLALALAEPYDLIILDRMLPHLTGIEVCEQLRKEGVATPVLMLTAKTEVHDRVDGLDAGADDYLGKPFAFAELLARVRALTRRGNKLLQTEIEIGDLKLNPQTYHVERAHQTIDLSKKEYSLLEFLMRHPGQVFSKEQLAEHVWSYDSDILPNTVQVYIGYLRKKIDTAFADLPPRIETVHGFGYRLTKPNNHHSDAASTADNPS